MYQTLIDADTLCGMLGQNVVVLDCRFSLADTEAGRLAWQESHIPGAHYAHLDDDLSGPIVPGETGRHPLPERERLSEKLRTWGISRDTQVVVADGGNGAIAARAWWLLRWLGHEAVAVLDGGYAAWEKAALPLSGERPATPIEGSFTPGDPLEHCITIDDVDAGSYALLDAREAPRYRGEQEPIDPVAGHIPGAANLPFTDNLTEEGRMLPPEVLRQRFGTDNIRSRLPAESRRKPLAHYCGSGVTAAHNVLAMRHAGLEPGALYAGSFSEWITRDGGQREVAHRVRE